MQVHCYINFLKQTFSKRLEIQVVFTVLLTYLLKVN